MKEEIKSLIKQNKIATSFLKTPLMCKLGKVEKPIEGQFALFENKSKQFVRTCGKSFNPISSEDFVEGLLEHKNVVGNIKRLGLFDNAFGFYGILDTKIKPNKALTDYISSYNIIFMDGNSEFVNTSMGIVVTLKDDSEVVFQPKELKTNFRSGVSFADRKQEIPNLYTKALGMVSDLDSKLTKMAKTQSITFDKFIKDVYSKGNIENPKLMANIGRIETHALSSTKSNTDLSYVLGFIKFINDKENDNLYHFMVASPNMKTRIQKLLTFINKTK